MYIYGAIFLIAPAYVSTYDLLFLILLAYSKSFSFGNRTLFIIFVSLKTSLLKGDFEVFRRLYTLALCTGATFAATAVIFFTTFFLFWTFETAGMQLWLSVFAAAL